MIPLAPRAAFHLADWTAPVARPAVAAARSGTSGAPDPRAERDRLGLPRRYVIYSGRYDARQDLGTLLRALRSSSDAGRPAGLAADEPWPPRVLLAGATPDDRAALARAAAREDVGEALVYAPRLDDERLAALVRGARAALLPVLSDAPGCRRSRRSPAACRSSPRRSGRCPRSSGAAGILVEPRDSRRLASALETALLDDRVHATLVEAARERAAASRGPGPTSPARRGPVYAAAAAPTPAD